MRTTIDAAGRIVIPKAMRDRLGLVAGAAVDVREREGGIELEPAVSPMSLTKTGLGLVAVPRDCLPPLTAETVRATLERTRR